MRLTIFAVTATLTAASAFAAPAFIKFDGVDAAGKDHKPVPSRVEGGEIEVLSWSWGATRTGGKMHLEDISAASKDGGKGGNVEFEWKVEEGESAPTAPGGVRVAAGDVDGDGRADLADAHTIKSPRDSASGQANGKRQHKPVTISKPLDQGTVWVRVATPWTDCQVGKRYPALTLGGGDGKTYRLHDVTVANCGRSRGTPTEEVAFYYNKIAFNYAATPDR